MNFNRFFAVALALTTLLAGCSKDEKEHNEIDIEDTNELSIRIMQPGNTRMVDDDVDKEAIVLSNGYLVFTTQSGTSPNFEYTVTKSVKIVSGTAGEGEVSIDDLTSAQGTTVKAIPSTSTHCHVFANYDQSNYNSLNYGKHFDLNILKGEKLSKYSYAYDVNKLVSLNHATNPDVQGVKLVPIFGFEKMDKVASGKTQKFKVEVEVRAIASRIQIKGLKVRGTDDAIESFKVKGIFINNYFTNMPYICKYASNATPIDKGEVEANYPGTIPSVLYDNDDVNGIASGANADRLAVAGANKYWAYNVLPNLGLTRAEIPHVVIRLDIKLTTEYGGQNEIRYLTVTGYKDGTNSLQALSMGNAYTVQHASGYFEFDYDDTTELPEQKNLDGEITIKPIDWTTIPVEPELN